jgi:hypothetical protein
VKAYRSGAEQSVSWIDTSKLPGNVFSCVGVIH